MRWKTKKKLDVHAWHQWFAWKPVQINDEWIWFEKIYRRADGFVSPKKPNWEYAADEFAVLKSIEDDLGRMKARINTIASVGSSKKAPMFSTYPPPPTGPATVNRGF